MEKQLKTKPSTREENRFNREAKALQKNLEKRKLQQQKREEALSKKNETKEENHGQD